MKKSILFSPLYLGTFLVAFSGFSYIKLNPANNTSDQPGQHANDHIATISPAEQSPSAWRNTHTETATSSARVQQDPDEQMSDGKTARNPIAATPANRNTHRQNPGYQPQSVYAPSMSHTAEYKYTETENIDHDDSIAAASPYPYNGYSSNSFEHNISSTDTTSDYNKPSVAAENFSDTTAGTTSDNAAEIISDGSSQQGLAIPCQKIRASTR